MIGTAKPFSVPRPDLTPWLCINRSGKPLVPAGSPRDMFLYVREERLTEALQYLGRRLRGAAEVCLVHDLVEQGFFGPQPLSPAMLAVLGNLVILPEPGESVWWHEECGFAQSSLAHHGGCTPEEMETQLIAYAYA